MAASLRMKALDRSLKTNSAAYYSYVDDSKNPVLQSFEAQVSDFKNYVAKQPKFNQTIDGRLSETLFQLWGSYQSRISVRMYCEKLMHLGEFLVGHEKYNIALFQCYQRYLNEFGSFHMQDFHTVDEIEARFFPNGLSDPMADISFRALMGCALCLFYLAVEQDPKVQLDETLDRCLATLSFVRLLMNVSLKEDRWSWLVYNGTIYLYKMSRYLMTLGYSLQVVEYLVWAAVSTEMCLPLLSVSYLPWRSTLYCAACEAFYDTRVSPDGERAIAGENFARRALEQFKNLHELQAISIEGDRCGSENSFRHATIKVATMLFKRLAFEGRRKAKGVFRPKVRQNYRDLAGAWPRTLTEKLLGDMFDCRCAQFLAILQALSNSNRRLVLTSPAAAEQDMEIIDVTAELFYAAQYILQVKHANIDQIAGAGSHDAYPNITSNQSVNLLELAVNGQYVIPLSYVVQLLKLAFNYQVYDIFDALIEPVSELVERTDASQTSIIALLQLLHEIEQCEKERKVVQTKKTSVANKAAKTTEKKKVAKQRDESPRKESDVAARKKSPTHAKAKVKKTKAVQALLDAAKRTRSVTMKDTPVKTPQAADGDTADHLLEELLGDLCALLLGDPHMEEKIEPDVLIDVSLLLWNKCRSVLRRFYHEPNDNQQWLTRLDHDHIRWIDLCMQTHEIMSRYHVATVDSSAYAECSLRLGQLLSALIQPSSSVEATNRTKSYKQRFDQLHDYFTQNFATSLLQNYTEAFKRHEATLEQAIPKEGTCGKTKAHTAHPPSSIDKTTPMLSRHYPLVFFAEQFLGQSLRILAEARSNLIRFDGSSMFDRDWSAKSNTNDDGTDTLDQTRFLATQPFHMQKGQSSKLLDNLVKDLDAELHFAYCRVAALLEQIPDARALKKGPIDQYLNDARGNAHQKALLCAAYASAQRDEARAAEFMQKAYKYLLAAEEEDRLYFWHHHSQKSETATQATVPRPCIIARAPDFVFVMAPDFGSIASKVATYRIFCRAADRPNAKARMADTNHPGSGQHIPASFIKPVKICGLEPNLKYVFSLAMYDDHGHLIGESVSESTEPILAAHPISLLFIRCLLSQVSYEIKQYTVAKKVFHSLWTYFVRTPAKPRSSIRELPVDNPLVIHELQYSRISDSSISLLQKFLNSIFIDLEICIKENHFYCDTITPMSSNRSHQISRIHACSQLLMALELSCWLNDASYALQAIIYLYGLLTPFVFHKIFYPPIYEIFERCLSVLEEIAPQVNKQRSRAIQENVQHMIACISYYTSQYLHRINDTKLSQLLTQIGKKFLTQSTSSKANLRQPDDQPAITETQGQMTLPDNIAEQLIPKMHTTSVHNEELKALERFVARERTQHIILTGNEEPAAVFAFIQNTPPRQAYKEIQKFRKRATYMEYVVQILTRALLESTDDDILSWYDDNQVFISKRNDLILGPWRMIITRGDGILTIAGSNENKYAAALTEFGPERNRDQQAEPSKKHASKKRQASATKKILKARPARYRYLIAPHTPDVIRLELEQRQRSAIDKLFNLLPDLYRQSKARRKFRRFLNDELVWRAQYESLNGLYCVDHLSVVIRECNEKVQAVLLDGHYRFDRLNPNLFTYDHTNLIIRTRADNETLDDATLEQHFDVDCTQAEVNDRVELIHRYLLGQFSNPIAYLSQQGDALRSVRDRKKVSPNRQSQPKKTSPSLSPRHEAGHVHREKTDLKQTDPFGFKRLRDYIDRFYLHYRRALVCAHRASSWTLLQNVSKSLYDSIEQLIQYLCTTTLSRIFPVNALLSAGYQTMFIASELLLDMLYRTKPFYDNQNDKLANVNSNKLHQWFTNTECSWASATFRFEQPQDRTALIDLRLIRRFILRALHALYVAAKWEKLATIAIKFNALSDHYFADLTSPLLIAAQTALLQQLQDRQHSTNQPHFDPAIAALGRPIHPDDFYTLRPDKLFYITKHTGDDTSRTRPASALSLAARLDPRGSDFYAQTNRAMELISVPLDVEFSGKLLRKALDKTFYSSRSIMECRKLLAFYVYKQEQQLATDFLIFTPLAEDLQVGEEKLPILKDTISTLVHRPLTAGASVEFSPTNQDRIETSPSTQVTKESVIEAYQILSKLLLGQNRRDQYCQIVTELGDLYFHCDKLMESKTAWCDVIDTLLADHDVIISWFKNETLKSILSNRTQLLQKCGLWGCLIGAVVACKLAKYHIHVNCDQHLQTCLLASYFLRAIFFYSLPHSEHDIDYATLIMANATQLWPGIQLTSDEFRLNPCALMDTLAYTCEALIRHDICLHMLPVLTLYDAFAFYCRDLPHTVQSRLMRLRALIQLDLFHEAHIIVQLLLDGDKLPSTKLTGQYRPNLIEPNPSKSKPGYFDNSKSVLSEHNLEVLDVLLTVELSTAASDLYGCHLSVEFQYLLSIFFIRLASKLPVIANIDLFHNSDLKQLLMLTVVERRLKKPVNMSTEKLASSIFQDPTTRSLSHVKSYLMGTAQSFATKCLKVLQYTEDISRDYPSDLHAAEYELLIDCLSILAECAHQSHLDQLAARYALEILKVLSMIGADNTHGRKVANGSHPRSNTVTQPSGKKLDALSILFNSRYSHHITVYTWLKKRAQLCYFMLQQINTLGKVKGSDESVREEPASVLTYIEHGYKEAQQYQCESMQATFLLYQSLYNLSELVDVKENSQRLNKAVELFQSAMSVKQNNVFSMDMLCQKVLAQILVWEHQCVEDLDGAVLKLIEQKDDDRMQTSLLDALMHMRERIQMTSSSHPHDWLAIPIIPLSNLYSSLLLPLLFAKLRTATMIADYAYRLPNDDLSSDDLLDRAHTLFRQCLNLNRTMAERYVNIDCECLLHLARVARLQKRASLAMPLKTIVQHLVDAIRLCYLSTNDSQFIQTCYFELAIVLLEYTRASVEATKKSSLKSATHNESTAPSAAPSVPKQRQTNDAARKQQQLLKQAAAVAIRAATQMALNQKQRVQLPGVAEEFSSTNEVLWPAYVAGDIIGYYVFSERRRIYKSEAEREILTLAPHFVVKSLPESFDTKLDRLQSAATQYLTWLHLLNYQNAVAKRIDNRQLFSFDSDAIGQSNLFFLPALPRYTGVTQTLQSLAQYSKECIAIYPSEIYNRNVSQISAFSPDKLPQRASLSSARTMRSAQASTSALSFTDDELAYCPNLSPDMFRRELPDHQANAAFSLAWYSSNTVRMASTSTQSSRSSSIYGCYTTAKDDLIDVVPVPLERLLHLHKKYLPMAQVAETDATRMDQAQLQSVLQEITMLFAGKQTVMTPPEEEGSAKMKSHLTDSKALAELEHFLNAKFGAQTSHAQLRDWFIHALKQSISTFLFTQD